jgi:quercetin dioxygenase-like cupin family protein
MPMSHKLSSFVMLACLGMAGMTHAGDGGVTSKTILQTTTSWDGTPYKSYPTGSPQVTVLRIDIPAHSTLAWHQYPMINAAYVLSGTLTVEKKDDGQKRELHAGEALAETVDSTHRGYTGDQPVTLIVFYAGATGMPLSIHTQ